MSLQGPRTTDHRPIVIKDQGPRTTDQGLRTKDQGPLNPLQYGQGHLLFHAFRMITQLRLRLQELLANEDYFGAAAVKEEQ